MPQRKEKNIRRGKKDMYRKDLQGVIF